MNFFQRIAALFQRKPEALPSPGSGSIRVWRSVIASSFADAGDRRRYTACRAAGGSEERCRGVGDPGIGWMDNPLWRDDKCVCALPPSVWQAKWGKRKAFAHGRKVLVRINGKIVEGILGDTMPEHRSNHAGIDLNPGFAKALGLQAPFMVKAEWCWG
jgi:hypothetical protein